VIPGILRVVGPGKNIIFWHNVWFDNTFLAHQFPNLFAKVKKVHVSLFQVWNGGNFKLFLSHGLSNIVRRERAMIFDILSQFQLCEDDDSAIWDRTTSEIYFLISQYKFLNFRGAKLARRDSIWYIRSSLKVKLFFSLVIHNKVLTKNLWVKGWRSSILCKLCGTYTEITHHLFFGCSYVQHFLGDL
jgi:zinc-binding in reverse transcriptase